MKRDFDHCFSHLGDTEESAGHCIHCLKKNGEQVLYDEHEKRLKLGREVYDTQYSQKMKKITELLGINSRESYEEMDKKYNLTMY